MKYFSFLAPKINFPSNDINFFGKNIKNKYGVAAGLDKDANILNALDAMGFGFIEIGTVTLKPQYGNEKPRIFRINSCKSMLNSMGFPSVGSEKVLQRLKKYKKKDDVAIGVNIGRNKDGDDLDILSLIKIFHNFCDYLTVNISSPNTKGLRDILGDNTKLENLLSSVDALYISGNIKTPIFLKISPDVKNLQDIYNIACKNNISGFILTNTTTEYALLPEKFKNMQKGGISGKLLSGKSENMLKEFKKINIHNKFVFSAGGVLSINDADSRTNYGANAVQIYTGLIYGDFFSCRNKH